MYSTRTLVTSCYNLCLKEMTPNTKTRRGEDFLIYNNEHNGIIIFECHSNLRFMCNEEQFFVDGTFDHCPKYFVQLYTIHVYSHNVYVPLVYCLLKDKRMKHILNYCIFSRLSAKKLNASGHLRS